MNWRWRRSRRTRWSVRMRRPWSIAVLRPLGCSTSRLRWWSGSETASYLISSETLEGEHAIHFSLFFLHPSPLIRPDVLPFGSLAAASPSPPDEFPTHEKNSWTNFGRVDWIVTNLDGRVWQEDHVIQSTKWHLHLKLFQWNFGTWILFNFNFIKLLNFIFILINFIKKLNFNLI